MNKRLKNLTDKQIFILEQVADGKSDGEIAKELEYSIGNIRRHIDKMLVIFDVANRAALAAQAIRNKVIK